MAIASTGEYLTHCAAVRMRVTGTGKLRMELNSLDDVRTKTLVPFQMSETTNIEPTRLTNFTEQRIRLHGYIDTIDEAFEISTITLFLKQTFKSRPSKFDALPTDE